MKTLADWIDFNPSTRLEKDEAYPFIGMDAVNPGDRFVTTETTKAYAGGGARFRSGDTLFARITPCLENGKIAQYVSSGEETSAFGSTEFFVLRAIPGIACPSFVYYLSKTDLVRSTAIKSMVGASGRQRADVGALRDLPVTLPELEVQRRVGGLLSRYDDLIATNQRRIALLEQAVRLLFREWFVRMRFPGHELVPVSNGVPDGWVPSVLSDLVAVNPRTVFEKDREYPFVDMGALSETSMSIGERSSRKIGGGAKFKNGDTLFARITPCIQNGKTGFVQFLEEAESAASGSTEFIVFRSAKVNPWWIYCLSREDEFRQHAINSMAGSDGRQRVNPKCFDQYAVLQPPPEVLDQFDAAVKDSFAQVEALCRANQKLAQARDLLLPKLMSGQLDVSRIPLPEAEDVAV